MKHPATGRTVKTAILVFENFAALPVTGPMDVLNESCEIWRLHGQNAGLTTFKVELVGLSKQPVRFGDSVTVHPQVSVRHATRPDLILIPSIGENVVESIDKNRGFLPWIKSCAAKGTRVVSMCTGSFLLAETGLLDGRSATTHWFLVDAFRKKYPKVNVLPERLIVDEGNLITTGAGTAFMDLVMYLIELYCGHEVAVLCSKVLLIELGRRTQLPYTIFSTQRLHNDRQILQVQHVIESENHLNLRSVSLAKRAGMSLRNFGRRFRNATGETPSSYLQKFRVEKAKRLLETTNDTVEEIIAKVGYEDRRSFRRLFSEHTALSPKAYRAKYGITAKSGSPVVNGSFGGAGSCSAVLDSPRLVRLDQ
jgi:transcriptional regulator GlxA family with amidase domain